MIDKNNKIDEWQWIVGINSKEDSFTWEKKEIMDILQTEKPSIIRKPLQEEYILQKVTKLPSYDPNNKDPFQIDARYCDLSDVDIKDNKNLLLHAMFSNLTKRPKDINKYFNPEKILEMNKTPGLYIKKLHKKWITGKNVNIAIIDQALLMDHKEYKGKIKMYDEIKDVNEKATMHWAAVTSIAVGENIGVAPDAGVYYVGGSYAEEQNEKTYIKMDNIAEAIHRLMGKNEKLDEQHKIRVISISYGIIEGMPGYETCKKAIDETEKQWIYVVYPDDKNFIGALRNPKDNPDDPASYFKALKNEPRLKNLDEKNKKRVEEDLIFVPMNSKTIAGSTWNEDYTFDRYGWISRVMPYVAGLYALCCQVQPEINKDIFLAAVKETAEIEEIEGIKFKIINPTALIEKLEKENGNIAK